MNTLRIAAMAIIYLAAAQAALTPPSFAQRKPRPSIAAGCCIAGILV